MPLYDYQCAACGRRFEVVHGVHAEGPTVCPLCGKGPVRKAITAPAVHYKGSGWAKKERRATSSSGTAAHGTSTTESSKDASDKKGTKDSTSEGGGSEGGTSESATPAPTKAADAGAASTTD
jgi:putative FmdB family regulatory protein